MERTSDKVVPSGMRTSTPHRRRRVAGAGNPLLPFPIAAALLSPPDRTHAGGRLAIVALAALASLLKPLPPGQPSACGGALLQVRLGRSPAPRRDTQAWRGRSVRPRPATSRASAR